MTSRRWSIVLAALVTAAIPQLLAHAQAPAPGAALYEQGPKEKVINRFAGAVTWRTEMTHPAAGAARELTVKADVSIPKRGMAMTWSIRRNSDSTLPASHVIEIVFRLQANPPHGRIVDVSPTHMKQGENTPGTALGGLGVKVSEGFFMVGLSNIAADRLLNGQLLAERAWIDVGFLYEDGTRGMITLEKGDTGKRAFTEAFAEWAKPAPRR